MFFKFTTLAATTIRWPVSHTTHASAPVQPVCRTRLTTVQRIIDFSLFGLRGLPLFQNLPKREMTYYPPRSTILQNFSLVAQTVCETCVNKFLHSLALIFNPSGSSKVKYDGANRKPVSGMYKCSGFNVVSATIFGIFRVKILLLTF